MKASVSETLYNLVCKRYKNYEYFLIEFTGYVSRAHCREIPVDAAVFPGNQITVELPDELCVEIMEDFSAEMNLSNALNILMMSGILMGDL